MTDPQIALVMMGLFIISIMLGFPIAFTLMAMGVFFGFYAYWTPGQLENIFANRVFDLLVQRTYDVMSNDILVEQLSSRGAPFVVEIALEPDESTASGFRWSSPRGPPIAVESGTSVEVRVVVDSHSPISLVLPVFRSALGLAA